MTTFGLDICAKCCGRGPTKIGNEFHLTASEGETSKKPSCDNIDDPLGEPSLGIYAQLEHELSNVSTIPPAKQKKTQPNRKTKKIDKEDAAMAAGTVTEKTKDDTASTGTRYSRHSKTGKSSSEVNYNYLKNLLLTKGFHVGKELSRGSFAIVREAEKLPEKQPLAVKVVDCSKAPEDFVTHFFPRELKVIRELKHEHIIQVFDIVKVCLCHSQNCPTYSAKWSYVFSRLTLHFTLYFRV